MVRQVSVLGYSRASYELNLGCNWDCEHCYLGLKQSRGLAWDNARSCCTQFATLESSIFSSLVASP